MPHDTITDQDRQDLEDQFRAECGRHRVVPQGDMAIDIQANWLTGAADVTVTGFITDTANRRPAKRTLRASVRTLRLAASRAGSGGRGTGDQSLSQSTKGTIMQTPTVIESQSAGAVPPPDFIDAKVDPTEMAFTDSTPPGPTGDLQAEEAGECVAEATAAEPGTVPSEEAVGEQPASDSLAAAVGDQTDVPQGASQVESAVTAPGADPEPECPDYGMPVHEVADYFPLMNEADLEKLAEDIRANGLVNPVVLHEGKLVDGRNRILACRRAGVEPQFVEWREACKGEMTLAQWIWSINGRRRHMTTDQIVAAYILVHAYEEREAARLRQIQEGARQGEHGAEGGRGNKKPLPMKSSEGVSVDSGTLEQPHTTDAAQAADLAVLPVATKPKPNRDHSGEVRRKIAQGADTSEYKAQQAINVGKADPDQLKDVATGKRTLREAEKVAKGKVMAKAGRGAKRGTAGRKKQSSSAAKPFNMEKAVTDAMVSVDKVLETLADEHRDAFIDELIRFLREKVK